MEELIFTQEEKDELLALRKEKKVAEMTAFAENQLEKYGAPKDFAPFLVRESDEETENAVRGFSESFGRAKQPMARSEYHSSVSAQGMPLQVRLNSSGFSTR